ncbi:parallel beta-helix repeat protein [Methanococcus voltae]|uniref:NosD domain-containing protein n=1 Tax=Methanococcus voltae TaxID=2188 RepID=UPI001AE935AD|nr:right-handed parallel beta-helix repeat-containing protein [Methanococcus voltae]MBP2144468.1 parallel beta-helix repeat protein [Methanococcus voltae]
MKLNNNLIFFILLIIAILSINTVYAEYETTNVGYEPAGRTICGPGIYYIDHTLPTTQYDAIVIKSDDVTIIGRAAPLISNNGLARGIYGQNLKNITIKNTNISGYHMGIHMINVTNISIINNNLKSNGDYNIHLIDCPNSTIINNTVSSGITRDIYTYNCPNSSVIDNTVSSRGDACIHLEKSPNSTIINNTVSSSNYGITLWSSPNSFFVNNTADSSECGIHIFNSPNTPIINNRINSNKNGMYIDNSKNNTIKNNTANSNSINDIVIDYSSHGCILVNNSLDIRGIRVGNTYDRIGGTNTHTIKNNTMNGRPIYYYKNNNTGKVPEDAGQVILMNCSNMLVENLNISGANFGITAQYSTNCNFTNNTVNSNSYGLYIENSQNSTITNNTANSNKNSGIYMGYSQNSTITNNTVNSNKNSGIYLSHSKNNTVITNTVHSNLRYGIHIYKSQSNPVINNTISLNIVNGIYIEDLSNNNQIINNTISLNKDTGVFLSNSHNNYIVKNVFNNVKNVHMGYGLNYWNTTKEKGGGNTWITPKGTGFSETHADLDKDGFCDEPYNISKRNVDYLPIYRGKSTSVLGSEPTNSNNNDNNKRKPIDDSPSIESSSLRRTVSNSNVVYGSSFDKQLAKELKENIHSDDTEIDGDTIIIGGPRSNRIANQYNDRFSIPVTNDNPGENRGIIQVISIPSGSSTVIQNYKLIYIAGSDRLGTEAALKYFETLTELPTEPIVVGRTSSGYKVVN